MDIKEAQSILKEQISLKSGTIQKKQEERAGYVVLWLNLYYDKKKEIIKLEKEKSTLAKSIKKSILEKSPRMIPKTNLDSMILEDESYIEILEKEETLRNEMSFYKECVDLLKSFAFDLKNLVEILKFDKIG